MKFEDFIAHLDYSAGCEVRVYMKRVFHKWTKDKKWKERWRAGWMPVLEYVEDFNKSIERGYSSDESDMHGAN